MACGDKVNLRCGAIQYSVCIKYEGELPEYSELDECANLEQTTEELYSLITEIREDSDLSELEAECLTLPTDRTVKSVMQVILDKICAMQDIIDSQQEQLDIQEQQIIDLQENNCP